MEHPSLPTPLFTDRHLSPFVNAADAFGLLVGIHGAEFIGADLEDLKLVDEVANKLAQSHKKIDGVRSKPFSRLALSPVSSPREDINH